MSNDNFELDDNIDSLDMDFGDEAGFDESGLSESSGRGTVEKVSSSFLAGAAEELTDPTKVSRRLKKVLPDTYSSSFDAVADASGTVNDITSSFTTETKEGLNNFKKAASGFLESKKDILPESLVNRLGGLLKTEEDYKTESKGSMENAAIDSSLGEIFGAQMEAQARIAAGEEANAQVSEVLAGKRHEDQKEQLFGIRQLLHRQVDYQDKITAKYQRKSLELKYRQLYVSKDMLNVLGGGLRDLKEASLGILKNTALPEFKKIQLNEASIELFRDSVLGNVQSSAADFTSNFLRRGSDNLKSKAKEFGSSLNNSLSEAAGFMESISGDSLEGVDKVEMASQIGGGIVGDYGMKKMSPKLKALIAKNPKIAKMGLKANTLVDDVPRMLNEYLKSNTESEGIVALMEDFIKTTLQSEGLNSSIKTSNIGDSTAPAIFDNLTRRSIVEIIPGYLSRIHQEIASIRGGMGFTIDPSTRLAYSSFENKFTTQKDLNKTVSEALVNKRDVEKSDSSISEIIDNLIGSAKLPKKAYSILYRRILEDNFNNVRLDIIKLSDPSTYSGVSDTKSLRVITSAIKKNFNIEKGTVEDTLENAERINKSKREFNKLADNVKDPKAQVEALLGMGLSESIDSTGLATRLKGGEYKFEYDKLFDLYSGQNAMGVSPTPKGGIDKPVGVETPSTNSKVVNIKDYLNRDDVEQNYGAMKMVSGSDIINPIESPVVEINTDTISLLSESISDAFRDTSAPSRGSLDAIAENTNPLKNTEQYRATHISLLTSILENMSNLSTVGGGASSESLLDRTKATLKGVANGYGKYLSSIGSTVKGLGSKAKALFSKSNWFGLKSIHDSLSKRFNISKYTGKLPDVTDLFINGESLPRIEAFKLKSGVYYDSETGKPITTLMELLRLKGNLMETIDGEPTIVISSKELRQGLMSKTGLEIKSKGSMLLEKGKDLLKTAFGFATKPTAMALGFLKRGYETATGWMDSFKDVYIAGTTEAVLSARKLKAGEYIDSVTGEVIKSLKDIKGDVLDKDGNIVVSFKDLLGGTFDSKGNPLKGFDKHLNQYKGVLRGLWDQGVGIAKSGIKMGMGLLSGGLSLAKKGMDRVTGAVHDFFNPDGSINGGYVGMRSLDVLKDIRDILDTRLPKKKRNVHDLDGDGDREGSWQDKFSKKEDKGDSQSSTVDSKGNRRSFKERLMGFVGGMRSNKKDDDSGDDSGMGLLEASGIGAALAGAYGLAKKGAKKIFGKGKSKITQSKDLLKGSKLESLKSKGSSLLSKGGSALSGLMDSLKSKFGSGGASKVAGKTTAKASTSLLARAAPWLLRAGGVAVGLVSLPVLIGGTIAAGVLGGGYYLYKKYSGSDLKGFDLLRITQYGFDKTDTSSIAKAMYLEDKLFSIVQVGDGGAKIEFKDIDVNELMSGVGIDINNPESVDRFKLWFRHRFIPVFLASAGGVKTVTKLTSLKAVDSNVEGSDREDLLVWMNSVSAFHVDNVPAYEILNSPFNSGSLLQSSSVMIVSSSVADSLVADTPKVSAIKEKLDSKPQTLNLSSLPKTKDNVVKLPTRSTTSTKTVSDFVIQKNNRLHSGKTMTGFNGGKAALNVRGGHSGSINDIPMPIGDGSWDAHRDMIVAVSKMVGVDPGLMATMAAIESNFNSKAKARTSSASGLYQFINGTWKSMLSKYGKKYGIAPGTTQFDPRANALMGAEYLKENSNKLKRVLDREITDTDMYLAHFLGAGGASKFLTSNPNDSAVKAMPSAARANPSIFRRNGIPRTMGEVYSVMDSKVSKFRNRYADDARQHVSGMTTVVATGVPVMPNLDSKQPTKAKSVKEIVSTPVTPVGSTGTIAEIKPPAVTRTSTLNAVRNLTVEKSRDLTATDNVVKAKQIAMLNDLKGKAVNEATNKGIASVVKVLGESLLTQRSINDRLVEIRDIIKSNGDVTKPKVKESTNAETNNKVSKGKIRTPQELSSNPVSLRRTRVN